MINPASYFLLIIIFFSLTFLELHSRPVFTSLNERTTYYKDRYNVNCLNEKITNNFGNGFDSLYGTRNMKPILFGIAYRGGANNYDHKNNKRDNQNPLPTDGLNNLCKEGFSKAIYLYGKNFNTAPKLIIIEKDTLSYIQNSAMHSTTQRQIMKIILDRIEDPNIGPIYLHC